jgi:hypothetical protein
MMICFQVVQELLHNNIILSKCLGVEHHTVVTSHSFPLTFSLDLLSIMLTYYALHARVVSYVRVCTQMHAAYMRAQNW